MDRFRAQNYKIIERYASLIQYFLYLELIFVPLQQRPQGYPITIVCGSGTLDDKGVKKHRFSFLFPIIFVELQP